MHIIIIYKYNYRYINIYVCGIFVYLINIRVPSLFLNVWIKKSTAGVII